MKRRTIRYAPEAERDLERLSDWLADVASEATAIRYIRQIKQRIESLSEGSERGTIRDSRSKLRVVGVLKSVSVAFHVDEDAVNIQRVMYGGQDWQSALTADDGDD